MTSTSCGEVPREKQESYYKLRRMFPNISSEYIKTILINPNTSDIDVGDDITEEESLIEHLLIHGEQHIDYDLIKNMEKWKEEVSSPEEQYARLIGILPDADPDFLEEFAQKNYDKPQTLNHFIEQCLIEKNYPTRTEYVERKKLEQAWRIYFAEFDVKRFINELPDPFEHFEGRERICAKDHNGDIRILITHLLGLFDINKFDKIFESFNYNATLTVKKLQEECSQWNEFDITHFKEPRREKYIQEFSFIYHRELIREYLNQMKNDSAEQSKHGKDLLNCECCLNTFTVSACTSCENGHIFCNDCILSGTEYNMANAKYFIKCFQDCEAVFSLGVLQKILKPTLYNVLEDKQQEMELEAAKIGKLETCPFCDQKSVVEETEEVFVCSNEQCSKESCRVCKRENHAPKSCSEDLTAERVRMIIEENMSKAILRTCYNCHKEFVKEEGCNHMVCPCGAAMCYVCDEPVGKDYSHFNGQGSDKNDLCPLFSDDNYREIEAVISIAEVAKEEVKKRNPEINLDFIESLKPILPLRTAGPHDQISNSDELPEHAVKVAQAIIL